jgi:hypothetical protein
MTELTTGVVVRRVLRAIGSWDLETYRSLLAPDAVEHRPQLGLRFVGRDDIIGMYRSFEGAPPTIGWQRITGEGTVWVGQGRLAYPAQDRADDHVVIVLHVEAGKVTRVDQYIASPTEPGPHQARWGRPEAG